MPNSKHNLKIRLYARDWIPKDLKALCIKKADAEFTSGIDSDDNEWKSLPKLPSGFEYANYSGCLLTLRNVEPHTDDFSAGAGEKCGGSFGLLKGSCILQVGEDFIRMQAGDWVIFNDSVLHSVQSDRKWYGVAVQINDPSEQLDLLGEEDV